MNGPQENPTEPTGGGKQAPDGVRVTYLQRSRLAALLRSAVAMLRGESPFHGSGGLKLAIMRTVAWPVRYLRWRWRCKYRAPVPHNAAPPATMILTSFARPQNMAAQVDAALACDFVEEVIVLNHNPAVNLAGYVRQGDPRLRLIQREAATKCGKRIEVARELDRDYWLVIDDDLYLWPEQIAALVNQLAVEPERLHGIAGQVFGNRLGLQPGSWRNMDRTVEVINRVYAFTKRQAGRFGELAELLRKETHDEAWLNFAEDVLLSYSGMAWPRMHNLGAYIPDPTSMDRRSAVHGQEGFQRMRANVVRWCRRQCGVNPGDAERVAREGPA